MKFLINSERTVAMTIYDFSAKDLSGKEVSLADFKGKVLIIANTASKCGFTPHTRICKSYMRSIRKKG
jgi:glutathione peroxidase